MDKESVVTVDSPAGAQAGETAVELHDAPGNPQVESGPPATTPKKSKTRKEDLLIPAEELNRVWILRKVLNELNPSEAMELLVDRLKKTKSNADFLISMNKAKE